MITEEQLEAHLRSLPDGTPSVSGINKAADLWIDDMLMLREAKRDGTPIDPEQVSMETLMKVESKFEAVIVAELSGVIVKAVQAVMMVEVMKAGPPSSLGPDILHPGDADALNTLFGDN